MSKIWRQDDEGFIHSPDGGCFDSDSAIGLLQDYQDAYESICAYVEELKGCYKQAIAQQGLMADVHEALTAENAALREALRGIVTLADAAFDPRDIAYDRALRDARAALALLAGAR